MSSDAKIPPRTGQHADTQGLPAPPSTGVQQAGKPPDQELWARIQQKLKEHLGLQRYAIWFNETVLMELGADALVVGVPNVVIKEYLQERYSASVSEASGELLGRAVQVKFEVAPALLCRMRAKLRHGSAAKGEGEEVPASADAPADLGRCARQPQDHATSLEDLLITSSNRLPYLAACEIAAKAEPRFHLMIILGARGLGKTSLLKAVCNAALGARTAQRCEYAMAEGWWNDYYHSIQDRGTKAFRRRYRECGVLAVDDIEFLDGKMKGQEELVHTVKSLLARGGRVVLGSTIHPKHFERVQPALRALVDEAFWVELKMPPKEERGAIVRELARRQGLKAGEAVLAFLGDACGGSMQELSGAVSSLATCAWLQGRDQVDLSMARQVLSIRAGGRSRSPGLEDILGVLTEVLQVPEREVLSASRVRRVCRARQMGMYLARRLTRCSLAEIGRFFGGRKHSTVKHSIDLMERSVKADPATADLAARCEARPVSYTHLRAHET